MMLNEQKTKTRLTQLFSQSDPSPQLRPSGITVVVGWGGRSPSPLCFSEELALSWHTGRGGATAQWEERAHHLGGPWANPRLDSELWVGHLTGEEYGPPAGPGMTQGQLPSRGLQLFQMQGTKLLASPGKSFLPFFSSAVTSTSRKPKVILLSSLIAPPLMVPKTDQWGLGSCSLGRPILT